MLVEGGQASQNLQRATEMIRRAAEQNCAIVVLPECLDLGWTDPAARELAQPIPGPHSDRLAQAAQQAGLYVVAGLTERELDVLRLVAEGLTDVEVGERLFISPRTVGAHMRSIFAKLNVNSRAAASNDAGTVRTTCCSATGASG